MVGAVICRPFFSCTSPYASRCAIRFATGSWRQSDCPLADNQMSAHDTDDEATGERDEDTGNGVSGSVAEGGFVGVGGATDGDQSGGRSHRATDGAPRVRGLHAQAPPSEVNAGNDRQGGGQHSGDKREQDATIDVRKRARG